MSINEINIKIETLKEWEAIAAEASAMVESIKDEIKRHMDAQGLEELEAGTHIVRYTTVLSNRFDSTAYRIAAEEGHITTSTLSKQQKPMD